MNSSEEEYCALLLLAEEEKKEAAIPKKNRRILVRQHFEKRPVLVEYNTTFQILMNYFSHPRACHHLSSILVNCTRSDVIHTLKSIHSPTFIQIESINSEKFDL